MTDNPRPFIPEPCPECNGRRVAVECDPRMNLQLSAFIGTRLQALACLDCGYVSFYADREKLRKKFLSLR